MSKKINYLELINMGIVTIGLNDQLAACLKHCQRNSYEITAIRIEQGTVFYYVNDPYYTAEANKESVFYITFYSIISNQK